MTLEVTTDNKKIRRPGQYSLEADAVAGFRKAVANNQQTLAFEYLVYIVDAILEAVDERPAVEASAAPARKVTKAATASDD